MSRQMIHVLALLVVGGSAIQSLELASYITPCARNDPRLDECYFQRAKEAITHILKGDPNYGIPSLDPLLIEKLHIDLGEGLFLELRSVVIRGFNNVTVDDISHDMMNFNGSLALGVPKFTVSSDFTVGGTLLSLPINASGNANLTMTDVKFYMDTMYELVKKSNGKMYVQIYNTTVDLDMSRLYIEFENVFKGNKLLDENLNAILNANWKELFSAAKPFLLKTVHNFLLYITDTLGTSVEWDVLLPKEGIWI